LCSAGKISVEFYSELERGTSKKAGARHEMWL
jgi:hypothetical protein